MNKQICKIENTSLGFEHGFLFTAMVHVTYGCVVQGVGGFALGLYEERQGGAVRPVDRAIVRPTKCASEFIMRVLVACGVDHWERLKGRTIYALFPGEQREAGDIPNNMMPIGIGPLPTERGEDFLFEPWQARATYEMKIEKALFDAHITMVEHGVHQGDRITKDGTVQRIDPTMWLPGWKHR